jgi:hypothetical protein
MKFLLSMLLVLSLSGCMGGYIKVKDRQNEETCYVFYASFLRSVEAGKVSACGVTGSSSDSAPETKVISDVIDLYKPPFPKFGPVKEK